MEPKLRTALVAEVRQRRIDNPGATGWTPFHFDALVEEIDYLEVQVDKWKSRYDALADSIIKCQ